MWEVLKDLAAWLEWDEEPPLLLSGEAANSYVASSLNNEYEYRWSKEDNLFDRCGSPNAEWEVVYEVDSVRRRRRRIARPNRSGNPELFLIRKNRAA